MLEEWWQVTACNVAILVDGGRKHRSGVLAKPRGVVGTSAKEGDAKGGSADDHSVSVLAIPFFLF